MECEWRLSVLLLKGCAWAGGRGRIELLSGYEGGWALGVLVLELCVDFLCELGLVLAFVELGELELGEPGGDGVGGLGGELVVEVDGLGGATGLAVELGEGQLGQRGEIGIPIACDLLEGG